MFVNVSLSEGAASLSASFLILLFSISVGLGQYPHVHANLYLSSGFLIKTMPYSPIPSELH